MKSSADGKPARVSGRGVFWRYFAVFGAGMGLVLLLALAVETRLAYRESLARAGELQAAQAGAAASRIEQFLQFVSAILDESMRVPWQEPPLDTEDLRTELHRLMKLVPSLDAVYVVDGRDVLRMGVSRTQPDIASGSAYDEPGLIARARRDGAATGKVVFRQGLEPLVRLARASAASPGAVFVAELSLRNVSDVVAGLKVGSSGRVFVATQEGRMIAHPDAARTLQAPSAQVIALLDEAGRRARAGEGAAFEGQDADGLPVLATVVGLRPWNWYVVALEPTATALAPVRETVYRSLALMGAGLLMALAVSAWLARRLSRPIVALRRGTESIAAGNLDTRIRVSTGDEVEALADDFNRMAAELEEHTVGLERKVDEKTAALREAIEVAHDAMRSRAVFLAAASHDLRQPLYAISILADTLASEPLPPSAAAVLDKQRQAITVLRKLFDDILDLSRFDAREVRPSPRAVSLRELLAPCVLEHEVVSHSKGLRFESQIADAWVHTDPELLRRVVGNLLANAVRYTGEGKVSIVATARDRHAMIEISDTGSGIPPEHQSRVFEEFVQLDNPARERDRGVGLGLSIVKRIADLLELGLVLESAQGEGTRVTFQVPLAQGAEKGAAAEPLASAASGAFAGARVWIVEDDPLVRGALSMQFNVWGTRPAFAASAAELLALREADGGWPDAVILDDMLASGEQGLEIAMRLREFMDDERIVLVTGNVDPGRTEQLEASGLVVLRKPLTSADLAEWLRQALRAVPAAGG